MILGVSCSVVHWSICPFVPPRIDNVEYFLIQWELSHAARGICCYDVGEKQDYHTCGNMKPNPHHMLLEAKENLTNILNHHHNETLNLWLLPILTSWRSAKPFVQCPEESFQQLSWHSSRPKVLPGKHPFAAEIHISFGVPSICFLDWILKQGNPSNGQKKGQTTFDNQGEGCCHWNGGQCIECIAGHSSIDTTNINVLFWPVMTNKKIKKNAEGLFNFFYLFVSPTLKCTPPQTFVIFVPFLQFFFFFFVVVKIFPGTKQGSMEKWIAEGLSNWGRYLDVNTCAGSWSAFQNTYFVVWWTTYWPLEPPLEWPLGPLSSAGNRMTVSCDQPNVLEGDLAGRSAQGDV
ncbi:hypothetical protein VP01_596g3 [Puccinia sorghi]|uniref:Uncharacterized protein n=1 Tax=Puccinia sorghi TaxID=27349 RepID=A0A0L6UHM5_9BASI|nr:hypothetical protein VP01_596g3 [Puccinia sorghi]